MKNRYVQRARIDEKKFKEILRCFAHDLQANQIAQLTGLSRNSINSYLKAIRFSVLHSSGYDAMLTGETAKAPQLYLLQLNQNQISIDPLGGDISAEIMKFLKNQRETLLFSILGRDYSAMIDYPAKQFYYLHEEDAEVHKELLLSFWNYTRLRLMKFRGLSPQTTLLHLKECEFRFNNRERDLYRVLLTHFRKNPLKLHFSESLQPATL